MSVPQPETVEFYFNTRTKMVEKGRQSSWEHLMGPYDSREEAERALDIAQQRNDEWEDDDDAWESGNES